MVINDVDSWSNYCFMENVVFKFHRLGSIDYKMDKMITT